MSALRRICLFCGASTGRDPSYAALAASVGTDLAIRGIGIVEMEHLTDVPLALLVELRTDIERMPDDGRERPILGVPLPLISIDPTAASAASKVAIALDRMGLKLK